MSTQRSTRTRWLTLVSTVSLLLSSVYLAATVSAAAPNVNTGAPITVDGDFADWSPANDFFADMYRAGDPTKTVESKLYLRYDCTAGVLYVGVIPVDGVTVLEQDDDNFVKFGNTDKKVDGSDEPADATQPNFAYAPNGGGWEASFAVGQVSITNLNVHAQVEDGGSQTSAVAGRAIPMSISCTTSEPTPNQPTATPTPTPTTEPSPDGASLNIRKVDEQGNRLEGAVFTIEGLEGTFTTNENGMVCITGLENDTYWIVTEIEAPEGYEIAEPAWQNVEVDDDGDCDSPDAVFVNTLEEEPTETPTETETESPSETESESPSETETESPAETPRGGVAGGNPTPTPGTLPDTAVGGSAPISPALMALVAVASLITLAGAQLAEVRRRR